MIGRPRASTLDFNLPLPFNNSEEDGNLSLKLVAYQSSKFMDRFIKNIDRLCKIDYQTLINLHETQLNCIFTQSIPKNLMYLGFLH